MSEKVKPLPQQFSSGKSQFDNIKSSKTEKKRTKTTRTPEVIPFGKKNFMIFGASIGILVVGYYLLSLDGFVDAKESPISLTVAPIVIVAGYVLVIYAIMTKSPDVQAEIATLQTKTGTSTKEPQPIDDEMPDTDA